MIEQIKDLKVRVYDLSMQAGQHRQVINEIEQEINRINAEINKLQSEKKEDESIK